MKKCILYDDRICNDCGECLLCDLDPEKLCNNCGKCIEGDGGEFISMLVRRNDPDDFESSDEDDELDGMDGGFDFVEGGNEGEDGLMDEEYYASLSEEEKQLLAFLNAPIDLDPPEPISIDPELQAKWERILAGDAGDHGHEEHHSHELRFERAPASYGIRTRRRR
ncbi:MAG: hypothetical protein IKI64_03280 [Clostridia bacterium]|nr:hypothetical protein [Clostridia bacterium]